MNKFLHFVRQASLCLTAATSLLAAGQAYAQTMPDFSNGTAENWYYVVFSNGDVCLNDKGNGAFLETSYVVPGSSNLLWKLEGNSNDFTLRSQLGNYANFGNGNFMTTTTASTDACHFSLTKATHPDFDTSWEMAWNAKDGDAKYINENGGTTPGRYIICYTAGEANNALYFIPKSQLPETPVTAPNLKEYNISSSDSYLPEHRHTLWYRKPVTAETVANPWMEYGLPIGNGEFGAMVFGGIHCDRLQFNDKSVWTGTSRERGTYKSFGELFIEDISGKFNETAVGGVTNYVRNLDLEEGKANAYYSTADGSVNYRREYIASYPDKVVALRISADKLGAVGVRLSLFPGIQTGIVNSAYKNGCGEFSGKLNTVSYKAKFKVVPTGGKITTLDNCVEVTDADEVLIILTGATNYDMASPTYISDAATAFEKVDSRIAGASAKGWTSMLSDHMSDYQSLYGRAALHIGSAENTMASSELVGRYNKRQPNRTEPACLMLEELYYNYGRYLLISSSRGMDLPANLQGIWNNSAFPDWQCDIHSNINVQMNYWPAEVANLSELHMPYLNYIYSMALEHGEWQEYARRSGQTKGWTCFTQNNIFGHSDYAENYVIANAWYCSHLWKHYLYTLDRDFLLKRALPVMKSCAEFWMERLVKDTDGTWVAPAEWSPEHGPAAENGTAHAQQIVADLFESTLQALDILGNTAGVSTEFVAELKDKYEHLDKGLAIETYNGSWGTSVNGIENGSPLLREWKTSDFSVGQKEHRHQSHLMALFPFNQITPESEYFEPAVNSLAMRGNISTGWSLAWRIALWARALDGEHAAKIITQALRHSISYDMNSSGGGIYYNLLDSHSPFQIDGNSGYTAGVSEMLLQSYGGTLRLLPALSPYWQSGEMRGLKAEGNFEVSQKWSEGKLTEATIKSGAGLPCRIKYTGIADAAISDNAGNSITPEKVGEDMVSFPTVTGREYTIKFSETNAIGEIADNALLITAEAGVVTANMVAEMAAFTLSGIKIATSSTGVLDLRDHRGETVIVKASNSLTAKALKLKL